MYTRVSAIIVSLIGSLILLLGCESEVTTPGEEVGQSLRIENSNTITFGIKLFYSEQFVFYSLKSKDSLVLPAGSLSTLGTVIDKFSSMKMFDSISIYDSAFHKKYRVITFRNPALLNGKYLYTLQMPQEHSGSIVHSNTNVNFYQKGSSWVGFAPYELITGMETYFITNDGFKTIEKFSLPRNSYGWVIDEIRDSVIFAHDAAVYSDYVSLIISSNMGRTWSVLRSFPVDMYGFGTYNLGGTFLDETHQWFYYYQNWSKTKIYSLVNRSEQLRSTLNGYCVYQCKFLTPQHGYMIANTSDNVSPSTASNTYFFTTTDGGTTWSTPTLISSTKSPNKLFVFNASTIIVTTAYDYTDHAFFYKSTNGGITWSKIDINLEEKVRDFYFLNDTIAYLKGGPETNWMSSNIGNVYKSVNGGSSWQKISDTTYFGSKIRFSDEMHGYMQDLLYGEGQILYSTSDGGVTWDQVLYPYSYIKD